ncbi:MAG: InlB B-repeat-containing protein [Bacteroidota bacterium]
MKTNTIRNFLIALSVLAGISITGRGQVLMFDNFDYPSGDSLAWHNWLIQSGTSSLINPIFVVSEGLSHAGFPCSGIGNAAAVGTTGQDLFRGFTKQTLPGSLIYMACLAKVTSATTGDAFISFKESPTSPTNTTFRGRVYAKVDGSNNLAFGISKGAITAPASADYTPFIYSLNTTYLLVIKYEIIEGTTNDITCLFVNPVIGSPEPSPSAVASDITASDVGIGSVLLRQGTTGSSPTVIVDGVRVAKTWQQVLNISNIATLSNIKVDALSVTGFSPDVVTYNDTVPAGQTSVIVLATPTDWAASVVITPPASIPGISSILVTAENGTTTKTYTVNHAYAYYTVDLAVLPADTGTVSGGGVYGEGFNATVTASAATGYMFANWTDGGSVVSSNSVYTFLVSGNRSLVANFVPASFQITATASPSDGGTITGTGTVAYGGTATLTAFQNTGYVFAQWTEGGNVIGSNSVLVITNVSSNHDVVAQFVLQTLTVTGLPTPPEGGTITGSSSISYGSDITLNAFANTGFIFENWSENGTILGTDPVLTLTNVITDHTILGNFIESVDVFTVSATANPSEGGIITGTGNVPLGGSITLTAIANPNYVFLNWTEGGVILGTNIELTLTNVSENHNLVANFYSNVGIGNISYDGIHVYPTITSDRICIISTVEIEVIEVYNLAGQKIANLKSPSNELVINVSGWEKGFYLIMVSTVEGMKTRKVCIF